MKEIYNSAQVLFPSFDFSFEAAYIKKNYKISKQLELESKLLEMKETNAQLKKLNEPVDLFDLFEGTVGSRFDLFTFDEDVVSLWNAPHGPQLSASELLQVANGLRSDLASGVRSLFEQDYWKELIFLTQVIQQLQRELFEEWHTNLKSKLQKAMSAMHGLLRKILITKDLELGCQLNIHIPRTRKVITGNSIDEEDAFVGLNSCQKSSLTLINFSHVKKRKTNIHFPD